MLPESIANFHIPSSASVAAYLSRVSHQMETNRREYMPADREEGDLHPRYHEQWDTLIHSVVEEGVDDSGIQAPVLNRDKVFEMLKTHQTKTFQQGIIAFVRSVEEKVCKTTLQGASVQWHADYFSFAHCIYRRCRFQRVQK